MCIDRRELLRAGFATLAAGSIPASSMFAMGTQAAGGGSQRVIMINIRGGWDSLSVVVPHGRSEYYNRRPTLAIPAPDPTDPTAALPAETGIGINPLMPELHAAYTAGEMAIVQKTGYPNEDLSHFTSQDVMSRGIRDTGHPDTRGWLGRLGDLYFNQAIQIVGVGAGNKLDFVGSGYRPVVLDDLSELVIPEDPTHPNDSIYRKQKALELLGSSAPLSGFRAQVRAAGTSAFQLADQALNAIANYTPTGAYPANSGFADRVQDIARIIQGGLGTQVFYVETGGFDTHASQADTLANRLPEISGTIGALIADLKAMSEYSNTTLVVYTEFGRRNYENGGLGTDHGHGHHALVIGGAVAGGLRGTSVSEAELLLGHLPMEVDFRQIYSEVIQSRLGVGPSAVFPDYTQATSGLNLFV